MTHRHRTCPECAKQFSYEISRGKDRIFCGKECAQKAQLAKAKASKATWAACSVDGCNSTVRSAKCAYCEVHYYRIRRSGFVKVKKERIPPPVERQRANGYVFEYMPDHPLWPEYKGRRIPQHRRVFYDANGKGPFTCHWCDTPITWETMHVDHVNAVRHDNDVGNLVASCPHCNWKRGRPKMAATARQKSTARVQWAGEELCVSEWARRLGISPAAMQFRLKRWTLEDAMTKSKGHTGPK